MNGMKKNRIFSIGALLVAALVLAACTVTVEPPRRPVRGFDLATSWQVVGTNQYASCDNLDTIFEYTFYAENPARIESITEHYRGVESGRNVESQPQRRYWDISGNSVTVRAVFEGGKYLLPVSADDDLGAQAIVIVPDPIPNDPTREIGGTNFHIVVKYDDVVGTYTLPTTFVKAYAGCTPI